MKATSSRRQLIVAILLALAVLGAAMRRWAASPSLAHDIGTLLLVLWLPVIGNVVAYVIARLHRMRSRQVRLFEPGAAFTAHLLVQLMPLTAGAQGIAALRKDERNCTLVVGQEGFTARSAEPLARWLAAGQPVSVELELLRPELALPRLPMGTTFSVLAGPVAVGTGQVLQPGI